ELNWVAHRCSNCETINYIAVNNGSVIEGYPVHGVVPTLAETQHIVIRGLSVKCAPDGMRISNLNLSWYIDAGDATAFSASPKQHGG
ncbi:hypothetical protein, partial [Rubripirellula obstinata]|uniref:hypothetical protein n=1 Tax=Rubripirellula obstinata TaxID=406547 RepID=UPI001EE430E0